MSTSVPKALPSKLDIKRHSPSILYKPFFSNGVFLLSLPSGFIQYNGVARYTHQRETTGSSNDSLQLRPFSKLKTSLKGKNLLPEGANSFLYE